MYWACLCHFCFDDLFIVLLFMFICVLLLILLFSCLCCFLLLSCFLFVYVVHVHWFLCPRTWLCLHTYRHSTDACFTNASSCVDVHNIMYIAAIMVCIYVCSLLEGRANRSSEAE